MNVMHFCIEYGRHIWYHVTYSNLESNIMSNKTSQQQYGHVPAKALRETVRLSASPELIDVRVLDTGSRTSTLNNSNNKGAEKLFLRQLVGISCADQSVFEQSRIISRLSRKASSLVLPSVIDRGNMPVGYCHGLRPASGESYRLVGDAPVVEGVIPNMRKQLRVVKLHTKRVEVDGIGYMNTKANFTSDTVLNLANETRCLLQGTVLRGVVGLVIGDKLPETDTDAVYNAELELQTSAVASGMYITLGPVVVYDKII
jgi:hypothetical protein